ncbi:hypothetical protein AAD018_006540 [Aestuariibius insulae]|uniref:hypothetical protein n=1 Tax=Aestuariibius insulae TaxID=2058287 RepID=UPI00345ED913
MTLIHSVPYQAALLPRSLSCNRVFSSLETHMRALLVLPIVLILTACEPVDPRTPFSVEGRPAAQMAYFAEYPEDLLDAAADACSRPGDRLAQRDRERIRCESFLPPEATAGLILEFDGTVDDLPILIFDFQTTRQGDGYVVLADNFVRVPQRSGPPKQVRLEDPRFNRILARILAGAGGRPIA